VLEDSVAQHEVGAAGLGDVGQPSGVTLHGAHGDTDVIGTTLEGGERVGTGVDHSHPVAELRERDGEAAGAPADVEDVEHVAAAPVEDGLHAFPDNGGAQRAVSAGTRTGTISHGGQPTD
jgi:hypothetical protein